MNLEQRVQALEQEVELLKGQIQVTLLGIQEQLLNAKYPMLRADEPDRTAARGQGSEPEVSSKPSVAVKTIRITESDPDDEIEMVEPEKVKPSVRSSLPRRANPIEEVTEPSRRNWAEPAQVVAQQQQDATSRDWIELENWVSQKVEKLGIKRTRELINLYVSQEQFTRHERELLMEFMSIYGDSSEKTQPSRPDTSRREPEINHLTIVPQTRAVVEEIRSELRQKQNAKKAQERIAKPLNNSQELVLRLIAGILSAGDEESSSPSHNGYGSR